MAIYDQKLTQEIKKFTLDSQADLVGITEPKVFDDMPPEDKPMDVLHDAEAILVYAIKLKDAATGYFDEKWWFRVERRLARIDKKLTDFLTRKGYKAHSFRLEGNAHNCYDEIIETTVPPETRNEAPTLLARERLLKDSRQRRRLYCRIQYAAVAAGIGGFNKNRMVILPKYGPYFHLSMIITNAPLKPDKPFEENLCSDCNICIEACPTGARYSGGLADDKKCKPMDCHFTCLRVCNEKFQKQQPTKPKAKF